MRKEEERTELENLIVFLHYPDLKIPKNIRLYLVYEDEEYYLKDGMFRREHFSDFQYLQRERGQILDAFARFEFLIGEIIRFKIIGFETEKSDMLIDLISAIGFNRQISLLTDWKIIDSDLKKALNSLIEVRNGLAHKFFKQEIKYKNKPLMDFWEKNAFEEFVKDMKNSWKKLVKIYENDQQKIDYKRLANSLREINNLKTK